MVVPPVLILFLPPVGVKRVFAVRCLLAIGAPIGLSPSCLFRFPLHLELLVLGALPYSARVRRTCGT